MNWKYLRQGLVWLLVWLSVGLIAACAGSNEGLDPTTQYPHQYSDPFTTTQAYSKGLQNPLLAQQKVKKRIVENTKAFLRALPEDNGRAVAYDRTTSKQTFFRRTFSARQNDGRIRIGILLPLSAKSASVRNIAEDLFNAAQLALFDLKRPELTLLVQDTQGTPEGALKVTSKLLQDGVQIIIGPLFAASTQAITPLARNAGIPVLSLSNNRDIAGDGVWLMGFLPEQNLDRIIDEATARGHTRFAALIPETAYGQRIQNALAPIIEFYGGELVQTEVYQEEAQSMLVPVQRIALYEERKQAWEEERARLTEEAILLLARLSDAPVAEDIWVQIAELNPELKAQYDAMRLTETFGELPYDAIIMPEGGIRLRTLAPLLPYFDVDPRDIKFLGTGLWDDPKLSQEPPLIGGWYAAPEPRGWRDFTKRYEKIYGRRPPRLSSLAYDSVSLIAALTAIYPSTAFTHKSLTNPNGFHGTDGIFRLTRDGLNERGLAVLEIRRRRNGRVSSAPDNFVSFDQTSNERNNDKTLSTFSIFE